ncbi:hypothetical protein HII31_10291 [Pseudocercospora fuligena]|uniref:Uncharacterized protein n=1 Tax=Pseudocercospora fuligena TaxID=685502 RepID=A0A8H6RCW1_9PEZI|nr:hypothetical protein HII31_10291 [Pseudocercospora fuligena]
MASRADVVESRTMGSAVDRVFDTVELLENILLQIAEDHKAPWRKHIPTHTRQYHYGHIDGAKTIIAAQRVSRAIYATIRGSSKLQNALNFRPIAVSPTFCLLSGHHSYEGRLDYWRNFNKYGSVVTGSGVLEWRHLDKEALKMTFNNTSELLVCLNGSWQETYISYPGTIIRRLIIEWKQEGFPLIAEKDCCIVDPTLGALAECAIEITENSMEQGTCYNFGPGPWDRYSGRWPRVKLIYHSLKTWNAEIAAIEKWMT